MVIGLTGWMLRDFLAALVWSAVIALASWPYYQRLARVIHQPWSAFVFALLVGVLLLAPLGYALVQISIDLQGLVAALIEAQKRGIALPHWLSHLPSLGPWLAEE